jgi:MFS superfamily sulfate permease-like transporter
MFSFLCVLTSIIVGLCLFFVFFGHTMFSDTGNIRQTVQNEDKQKNNSPEYLKDEPHKPLQEGRG